MDPLEAQELVNYLREGEYPDGSGKNEKRSLRQKSVSFAVENNNIYHLTFSNKQVSKKTLVIIGGEEEKQRILKEVHCGTIGGGHFGQIATFQKVNTVV